MEHSKTAAGLRFTTQQTMALVAFTKGDTWGFHAEISLDHPQLPEMAHIWHTGPATPMFFIVPLSNNIVEIYDVLNDNHKSCTLEEALASITKAEDTSVHRCSPTPISGNAVAP